MVQEVLEQNSVVAAFPPTTAMQTLAQIEQQAIRIRQAVTELELSPEERQELLEGYWCRWDRPSRLLWFQNAEIRIETRSDWPRDGIAVLVEIRNRAHNRTQTVSCFVTAEELYQARYGIDFATLREEAERFLRGALSEEQVLREFPRLVSRVIHESMVEGPRLRSAQFVTVVGAGGGGGGSGGTGEVVAAGGRGGAGSWNFTPPFTTRATERSLALLLSFLSKREKQEFESSGRKYFSVEVKVPWTFSFLQRMECFTIFARRNNAIRRMRDGKEFCVVVEDVPVYDQMAALKLLLETNLRLFYSVAHPSFGHLT